MLKSSWLELILLLGSIVSIVILTDWLIKGLPTYFNSLYILLGSIFVFSLSSIVTKKNHSDNLKMKKENVLFVLDSFINRNNKICEKNLENIKSNDSMELKFLKENFSNILSDSIREVNFQKEILYYAFILNDLSSEINDKIKQREPIAKDIVRNSIGQYNQDLIDLFDSYFDNYFFFNKLKE